MTKTLAFVYSSESTQQELSNEYKHDRVQMLFKNLCALVLWTKVDPAFEELSLNEISHKHTKSDTDFVIHEPHQLSID